MKTALFLKKRLFWLVLLVALLIGAVLYLNRSYAFIYKTIDLARLGSTNKMRNYVISNNKQAEKTLVYAALGDSLTAGVGADKYENSYPYLLASRLASQDYKVRLRPHAVPGAKTSDLLAGLLPGTINDQPDIVTVLIGVNDIHGQVSIEEFTSNYENIVSRLTKETKAKIYLINIPYIGADTLILPPHNYFFQAKTKEYNAVIKALSEKYQVNYINLYSPTLDLFQKSGNHYAADLFHPSSEGYKIWANLIYDSFHQ